VNNPNRISEEIRRDIRIYSETFEPGRR